MKTVNTFSILTIAGFCSLLTLPAKADPISVLGSAASYAVLGASTVTNTGATVLSGNLGISPGASITGFPPGLVIDGTTQDGTASASQAESDALAGYNYLALLTPTASLTGQDLGGLVLTPGVYSYASSAQLTGDLILDFEDLNNTDIVLQIGSTLTTAKNSVVSIVNQGSDDHIYYEVGSSATLGTGTQFNGYILALSSVTLATGSSVGCGGAIALNGAVTLDANKISSCSTTREVAGPLSSSVTPEPATLWLVATGVLGSLFLMRRHGLKLAS